MPPSISYQVPWAVAPQRSKTEKQDAHCFWTDFLSQMPFFNSAILKKERTSIILGRLDTST